MNMVKSRDIRGKIPSPKVIGMDFDQVAENGVNSNIFLHFSVLAYQICILYLYFCIYIVLLPEIYYTCCTNAFA